MSLKNNKKIDNQKVAFFRFKKFAGKNKKYLLTNDVGDFVFLPENKFHQYLEGKLKEGDSVLEQLKQKGFIRNHLDFPKLISQYRSKYAGVGNGPSLHIVVTTLRCNHKCLYCHASSVPENSISHDMSLETARKTVDMIFKTTSNYITIEFQGGEPLLNWPVVKFITEYARTKNREEKKQLYINIISNFSLMNDMKLNFLLRNNVGLCTSLDGPDFIHNKNRLYFQGSSHENAVSWLKKSTKLYKEYYPKSIPAAVTTITKHSLPYHKEIVDQFLSLGMNSIYLRPLNPFGFAQKTWKDIGYSADEFIRFYLKSLDYIIEQNLKGKNIKEYLASAFLIKIFTDHDPNHLDYRSPCGAGIGQMAYNYNGNIYTCDEGRMFAQMGDDSFKIGTVKSKYKDLISSPVVRSMCVASCTDGLPGCSDCVYKPYCGVCPVYNYSVGDNIFGQMPINDRCKILKAIFDYLFEKMEDKKTRVIFEKWLGHFKDENKLLRDVWFAC